MKYQQTAEPSSKSSSKLAAGGAAHLVLGHEDVKSNLKGTRRPLTPTLFSWYERFLVPSWKGNTSSQRHHLCSDLKAVGGLRDSFEHASAGRSKHCLQQRLEAALDRDQYVEELLIFGHESCTFALSGGRVEVAPVFCIILLVTSHAMAVSTSSVM